MLSIFYFSEMQSNFANDQERSDAIYEIFRLRKLRVKLLSAITERNRRLRGLESRYDDLLSRKNREIDRLRKDSRMKIALKDRLITMLEVTASQKDRIISLYEKEASKPKPTVVVPPLSSITDNSGITYAPAPMSPIDVENNGWGDIDVEKWIAEFYGPDSA